LYIQGQNPGLITPMGVTGYSLAASVSVWNDGAGIHHPV
jgi:hypothetical protein